MILQLAIAIIVAVFLLGALPYLVNGIGAVLRFVMLAAPIMAGVILVMVFPCKVGANLAALVVTTSVAVGCFLAWRACLGSSNAALARPAVAISELLGALSDNAPKSVAAGLGALLKVTVVCIAALLAVAAVLIIFMAANGQCT